MTLLEEALEAFVVTAVLLGPVALALRHFGILDHPTSRSSHSRPTPRGGGIAIGTGALITLVSTTSFDGATRASLIVAAGGFGLIGVAEDVKGIPPLVRLIGQIVVALAALPWLLDRLGEGALLTGVIACALVLWIVGFANSFNFMDGINGIAAAQTLVAGTVWAVIAHDQDARTVASAGIIIAAAALAFAPLNFPSARVFLGDAGSYFIGAWLAVVVILGIRAGIPVEAMLGPVVICVADTFVTFARRAVRGARLLEPHREHTYQQLVAAGWSHARTVAFVAGLAAICSLLGAVSLLGGVGERIAADVMIVALVTGYLTSPRHVRTRS